MAHNDEILARLHGVKRSGDSGATAKCPAHDDRRNSLSLSSGDDGRVLLHCHAGCTTEAILGELGLKARDLFPPNGRHAGNGGAMRTFEYHDADGTLRYRKRKSLRIKGWFEHPNDAGQWVKGRGNTKPLLYRLPEILNGIANNKIVFVAEGEPDADRLAELGICSTSTDAGAGSWRAEYSAILRQAKAVVVCPDFDMPGYEHARAILESLPHAVVVELAGPNTRKGYDISDWLNDGHTREELKELAAAALRDKNRELKLTPPDAKPNTTESAKPAGANSVEPDGPDPLSELAAAHRLREHHGQDLRHARGLGWLSWDGKRWAQGEKGAARRAHSLGSLVRRELLELGTNDQDIAKSYYSYAKKLEKQTTIRDVLFLASALEGIDADNVEWDEKPWLFNAQNGTVDLRTGELREHDPNDCLTKVCPFQYKPEAEPKRWIQFLYEVFNDDFALVDYIQWACGYALSGSQKHQCFFVLHGAGENGKSTLVNALQYVWGRDFAQQIDSEELLAQKYARHSTERARLRGARLIAATETPEGRRLNETFIKALSGEDQISARFMRQDSFEFWPQCKLFLSTNHRPSIRDETGATWRRVRLIPFEVNFKGRAEKGLAEKLRDEATGILTWAIEGAKRAYESEPELPPAVKVATESYRAEEDLLGTFLSERCHQHENLRAAKAELFAAYEDFCGGRGRGGSPHNFTKRMRERGFEQTKSAGSPVWKGISLKPKELERDD